MGASADVIFALSSAPGRAGVSVFRMSGVGAFQCAKSLCGSLPKNRLAGLRKIRMNGETIDEALVLCMKGPESFTGEDVVEIQGHGSLAVLEAMSRALLSTGARQAEPGEFTRRAVLNGRMDLTEAEGLADLIDSETEGQRRQALIHMQGGLKQVYEGWRASLIDALAFIEGEIDFPDEGDVPQALSQKAVAPLTQALADMKRALQSAHRGERVRAGLSIAVIGAPNAGKSSLINRLAGRDAAIVSEIEGTTRDIVDVQMIIAGLPVRLSDTAGLRETQDQIEAEGVKRAKLRAEESDIRLFIVDASLEGVTNSPIASLGIALTDHDAVLYNKSDLAKAKSKNADRLHAHQFLISAKTGDGIQGLEDWLSAEVTRRYSQSELPGLTRERHSSCVRTAVESIERALVALTFAPELAGEDIRKALQALSELAGESDMEAVFDQIFLRFCIGK